MPQTAYFTYDGPKFFAITSFTKNPAPTGPLKVEALEPPLLSRGLRCLYETVTRLLRCGAHTVEPRTWEPTTVAAVSVMDIVIDGVLDGLRGPTVPVND